MSQLKLVDRKAELRFLNDQYSSGESGFLVISGRSRLTSEGFLTYELKDLVAQQ